MRGTCTAGVQVPRIGSLAFGHASDDDSARADRGDQPAVPAGQILAIPAAGSGHARRPTQTTRPTWWPFRCTSLRPARRSYGPSAARRFCTYAEVLYVSKLSGRGPACGVHRRDIGLADLPIPDCASKAGALLELRESRPPRDAAFRAAICARWRRCWTLES